MRARPDLRARGALGRPALPLPQGAPARRAATPRRAAEGGPSVDGAPVWETAPDSPIECGDVASESAASSPVSRTVSGWQSSRPSTRASTRQTSYSHAYSVQAGMSEADGPMPVLPWCGKCPPLRPYAVLPLRPEEVNGSPPASGRQTPEPDRAVGGAGAGPSSGAVGHRTEVFAERMRETIIDPGGGLSSRVWEKELEDIHLNAPPPRSRFSHSMNDGEDVPPVLKRLTVFQVGRLERWAINHVKRQFVEACAKEHHGTPLKSHRNNRARRFATMCQLVRRFGTGKLKDQEHAFLFEKLQGTPFFADIPGHLLPRVVKRSKVLSSTRQVEVFKQGAAARGIHVLVQGEVVLRNERSVHGPCAMKQAPVTILPGDIFTDERRPFCVRPEEQRVWSRTALVRGAEDAGSVSMLLLVPLSALDEVCQHFREEEARDLARSVSTLFAQAMSLAPKLCVRHSSLFRMEVFLRSEVLLQRGSRPAPSEARLMLVVEGEVCLVAPRRIPERRRPGPGGTRREPKERRGRGELVGQAALHGLPYPHTAIVASESAKILSISVADYLERFLHRTVVLEPPAVPDGLLPGAAGTGAGAEPPPQGVGGEAGAARALLSLSRRSCKISQDARALAASEWKAMAPKAELPKHRAPPGTPRQLEDALSPSDLCHPRGCDLLPAAQRSVSSLQRGHDSCTFHAKASIWSSSAAMSEGPRAGAGAFHALDARIARAAETSARLEAVHRAHTEYGMHIEDISGSPWPESPEGPLLTEVPDDHIVISCGAIAPALRLQEWQLSAASTSAS